MMVHDETFPLANLAEKAPNLKEFYPPIKIDLGLGLEFSNILM